MIEFRKFKKNVFIFPKSEDGAIFWRLLLLKTFLYIEFSYKPDLTERQDFCLLESGLFWLSGEFRPNVSFLYQFPFRCLKIIFISYSTTLIVLMIKFTGLESSYL